MESIQCLLAWATVHAGKASQASNAHAAQTKRLAQSNAMLNNHLGGEVKEAGRVLEGHQLEVDHLGHVLQCKSNQQRQATSREDPR